MEESKKCTRCKKDLPIEEFLIYHRYNKPTRRSRCRDCINEVNKLSKDANIDEYYRVYYLPKEKYVGFSGRIKERLARHKNQGRDITNSKVLFRSRSAPLCLMIESFMHFLGYKGCNYETKNKKRCCIND